MDFSTRPVCCWGTSEGYAITTKRTSLASATAWRMLSELGLEIGETPATFNFPTVQYIARIKI